MKKFMKKHSRELSIVIAIMIMGIVFAAIEPIYISKSNIKDIFEQSIIYGLMAVGMTAIIITGGIDLSVGSALALICVVVSIAAVNGIHPALCIIIGLVLGIVLGLVNGVLIAKLKLQPFIATLGTMSVYRGMAYLVSNGYPILGVPNEYRDVINGSMFNLVRTSTLFFIALAVFMFIVMSKLRLGTYFYAIGGNEEASRLSGIKIGNAKTIVYAIGMIGTALAAMIQVARLGTGDPTTGQGYELNAIAAVAIGGTSMAGGRGTVVGTLLGAILFAGLRNGLIVSNVATFWQYVATGVVIVIAAYIEVIQDNLVGIFKGKGKEKVEEKATNSI